jgi:protein-arginine kinase activator protein McsA
MTKDELDYLAERIADLVMVGLIEKQKEWDQQFTTDVNQIFGTTVYTVGPDEEQLLLAELARLMTLLTAYEEDEQYEKAAIINNKIQKIQNKLNKL